MKAVYAVGCVGNLVVTKAFDSGTAGATGWALLGDTVLLGLLAAPQTA